MTNSLSLLKHFAFKELVHKASNGEPLWIGSAESSFKLREDVYWGTYYERHTGPLNYFGHIIEASKDSAFVSVKLEELVELFVNMHKWSEVFHGIASKTLSCIDLQERNRQGISDSLQMIRSQIQLPSPLVAPRYYEFVRYCHKISDGFWGVVDFNMNWLAIHPLPYLLKRPSGCLIKEMPNGYCKIAWVEHIQVAGEVVHDMYKPLVSSGFAYGARRWLAALQHYFHRIPTATASLNHDICLEGRRNVLALTERLIKMYCSVFGTCALGMFWLQCPSTPDADGVTLMMKRNYSDHGMPFGVILSASMSVFLPVSYKLAFDFIRNVDSRIQWEILCSQSPEELTRIPTGNEPGNYSSILSMDIEGPYYHKMIIVQENCIDSTGAYLVFAPIDLFSIQGVLQGQDSSLVTMLPSGFALLPACRRAQNDDGSECCGGCLVTVAFQIMVDRNVAGEVSSASLMTTGRLVNATAERVKNGLLSVSGQ